MKRVVILDHGSGNLRSAQRAFARAGAEVTVSASSEDALAADGLVVPGVGAFAAVMAALVGVDGARVIRERHARQLPTLGICVGMQVLFTLGEEHGERSEGLGIWPGTVERLDAPRLPHMGWNQVVAPKGSVLFRGIAEERFYFVHSYAARDWTGSDSAVVTRAEHGHSFLAAVEAGALSATQFHPEKSGDAGATLIDNWVETL